MSSASNTDSPKLSRKRRQTDYLHRDLVAVGVAPSANGAPAQQQVFAPALSETFRLKIRPVLNSIDRLRSVGLQNELRLPTVAVVGDQSVGKSSVLEAISGVDLPRGTGIVTRCPLQLSMRSRPECDKWSGTISYTDANGQRVEHSIADKSQVSKHVHEAQNAITGNKTGVSDVQIDLTIESADVSDVQIDLTIESADVSDLTLVDLPGIARYSEKNANICRTTKDLIRKYIDQDEVIVLVVVPCYVDIETVEAIALAKEVDPRGERTIGVMTCPDLTNPGSEDNIIATLRNMGQVKLKKGFVMVKCRSPQELTENISLTEVSTLEESFFAKHQQFSQLSKDLRGTRTLADKLTDELFKAVAESMTKLEDTIKTKLVEYENELKELGDSFCESDTDKRHYMIRKLNQFTNRVNAVTSTTGIEGVTGCVSKLYSACHTECASFGQKLDTIKPPWVKDLSQPIPPAVELEVSQLRGRELPTFTFTFPIVQRIVCQEYLPSAKADSLALLKRVHAKVSKALKAVSSECFQAFPGLLALVIDAIVKVMDAKEEECRADLEKLMSQEARMFTQDKLFHIKLADVEVSHKLFVQQSASPFFTTTSRQSPQKQPAEVLGAQRVRLGIAAYLAVASQRVSDTVPMSILSHMLDGIAKDTEEEMTQLFANPDDLLDLLREDSHRQNRRRHLTAAVGQMKRSHADMLKAKRRRIS